MEYVLKLNEQQITIIGAALAEMPFKVAQPVLAAIQAQIDNAAPTNEQESPTSEGRAAT
jgi:hypothetical protein